MTIELNPLAVANAEALRALDGQSWANRADFARHIGKDPKNITRDLRILTDAGLVEAADNPDFPFALTAAARAQLAAISRAENENGAEHGGERRKERGVWPLDRIRPNLKNRKVDPESIPGMADSLAERGQLQPVLLTPPDAHGVRMILAGERRWLGALRLRDQNRLPESLTEGLKFIERDADTAEALAITLVENLERQDIPALEEAFLLRDLADAWDERPAEVARRLGRKPRDVQDKIKIAREATPSAISDYRAHGSWDRLRASLKPEPEETAPATDKSDIPLIRPQRLALAELFDKAGRKVGAQVRVLPAAHAVHGDRLAQYGLAILTRDHDGDFARVTQAGADYLKAEGLDGSIEHTREQLHFPPFYGRRDYTTTWLNHPADDLDPRGNAAGDIQPPAAAVPNTDALAPPPTEGDPWRRDGWTRAGKIAAIKTGTWLGSHLVADEALAGIDGCERLPTLTFYTKAERRFVSQEKGYEDVTLWRAQAEIPLPDGRLESTRIPGASSHCTAIQLATEDLIHAAFERGDDTLSLIRPAIEWLDRMVGEHVVGGRNCLNATRAHDRRVGLGWVKRPSNSGAGPASPETEAEAAGGDLKAPILDVQVFALPNPKPGWKGGPLIQIEVGHIEGQGWIVATRASYPNGGWGEPFHPCLANTLRFDSLAEAMITACATVRGELRQYGLNTAQLKQADAWLDQIVEPFVAVAPDLPAPSVSAGDIDAEDEQAAALLGAVRAWMAAPHPNVLNDLLRRLDCPAPVAATEGTGSWLNGRGELIAQFDPGGDLPDDQAQAMAELTAFIFAEGLRRCLDGAGQPEPQAA